MIEQQHLEPKILILLATHNREDLIIDTLKSIYSQTYSNWKCLIIDDNSKDSTREVVEAYILDKPKFSYFLKPLQKGTGLSSSRNFGLELANNYKPDFLQFFDDDDIMHPHKLELQQANLVKHTQARFSICGAKNFFDEEEILLNEIEAIPEIKDLSLGEAYLTGKIKFVAQVPLFRYDYAKKFKFDEDLFYAEEWVLFCMDFFLNKPDYSVIEKVLFYRRKHKMSITEGEDKNYSRRKTSAITGIKLFYFLEEHKLHSKISILYFTRQFLIYQYNSAIISRIKIIITSRFPQLLFRFKFSLFLHKTSRKVILRFLKY